MAPAVTPRRSSALGRWLLLAGTTLGCLCLVVLGTSAPLRAESEESEPRKLPTASSLRLQPHKHVKGVSHLAFSPDGRFLVTADESTTGLLHVWDWAAQKLVRTIESSWVRGLGFIDDTTLVHTELTNPPMLVYHDVETGELKHGIRLDYVPQALAVAPGSRRVAIGEMVRADDALAFLRLYEGATLIWSASTAARAVEALVFTPDGKQLLLSSAVNYRLGAPVGVRRCTAFDAATGARRRDLQAERALACSPDGTLLMGWGKQGRSIFEVATGRLRSSLPYVGNVGFLRCACFSQDGRYVFVGGAEGRVAFYDLPKERALRTLKVDPKTCTGMALSPDGGWLATTGAKRIRIWNLSKYLPRR